MRFTIASFCKSPRKQTGSSLFPARLLRRLFSWERRCSIWLLNLVAQSGYCESLGIAQLWRFQIQKEPTTSESRQVNSSAVDCARAYCDHCMNSSLYSLFDSGECPSSRLMPATLWPESDVSAAGVGEMVCGMRLCNGTTTCVCSCLSACSWASSCLHTALNQTVCSTHGVLSADVFGNGFNSSPFNRQRTLTFERSMAPK